MVSSESDHRSQIVRVRRQDVVHLRTIIESYEGLAIMTTLDKASTLIQVCYLAQDEDDVVHLLQYLENEDIIQEIEPPQ